MLIADDDPASIKAMSDLLVESRGWRVSTALTGGEALDVAAETRPQIVLVKDPLPDLPGRIVINSIKSSVPDAVALLIQAPSRAGGRGDVKMIEGARVMDVVQGYVGPADLAGPLAEIREGIRQKMKERRYLQAFRQANLEFLQRYNSVRQKITASIARTRR